MNHSLIRLALSVVACATFQLSAQIINITALGAKGDGNTANAGTNAKAFATAFANYPNGKIVVPPGNYAVDNSNGGIYAPNFNGELKFEGGAKLIFQNLSSNGIRFVGGSNTRIEGLHGTYATMPTDRVANELTFTSMTNLVLKDITAENSPGAGIWLSECIRPQILNAHAYNVLADGLALVNSLNPTVVNVTTINTIDNGLAFYNYSDQPNNNGGFVQNVNVRTSNAHGITVVGPSNVIISGFQINGTQGSAVWVGTDVAYGMRTSDSVMIHNGSILNPGTLPPAPNTNANANKYGLEYTTPVSCLFSDIYIENAPGRAVSGSAPNGKIFLRNVRSKGNGNDAAFVFYQTKYVDIADSMAENSGGSGFAFNYVPIAMANRLKAMNTSTTNSLHRAAWFQNGNFVAVNELMVADTQGTPTGNIVGTSDASGYVQKGAMNGIGGAINNGSLTIQSYSPKVKVQDVTK